MYSFPEQYGGEHKGFHLHKSQLREACEVSGILDTSLDINMADDLKQRCESHLPSPELVESDKAIEAYRFLKLQITS